MRSGGEPTRGRLTMFHLITTMRRPIKGNKEESMAHYLKWVILESMCWPTSDAITSTGIHIPYTSLKCITSYLGKLRSLTRWAKCCNTHPYGQRSP